MKICFATHNLNKLAEIQSALTNLEVISLNDISCTEEIAETGNTLEENSQIKADYVHTNYHLDCFSDDTGLEIRALNGAPGVYSARYAGKNCNSEDNINLVLKKLSGVSDRFAQFRTVITLIENGSKIQFEGKVEGVISSSRSGREGFGYDPIFIPSGFNTTFAEMTLEEKNKISHRGLALKKLITHLSQK